jgi:hypothetical protein
MTDQASHEYLEVVVDIHNRQFQRYSIERSIYHVPVDEVRHNLVMYMVVRALFPSQANGTMVRNYM